MGALRTPAKRKGLKNIDANATMATTELSYDDDEDGTTGGGGPLSPPSSKKKRDSESATRYSASTVAWGSPQREYARVANVSSLICSCNRPVDPLSLCRSDLRFFFLKISNFVLLETPFSLVHTL